MSITYVSGYGYRINNYRHIVNTSWNTEFCCPWTIGGQRHPVPNSASRSIMITVESQRTQTSILRQYPVSVEFRGDSDLVGEDLESTDILLLQWTNDNGTTHLERCSNKLTGVITVDRKGSHPFESYLLFTSPSKNTESGTSVGRQGMCISNLSSVMQGGYKFPFPESEIKKFLFHSSLNTCINV